MEKDIKKDGVYIILENWTKKTNRYSKEIFKKWNLIGFYKHLCKDNAEEFNKIGIEAYRRKYRCGYETLRWYLEMLDEYEIIKLNRNIYNGNALTITILIDYTKTSKNT